MDSSPACLSYWDAVYENDIENYRNHGDAGDEWFGSKVSAGVLKWISEKFQKNKNVTILDLGCGNGLFLIHLAQMEFLNLTGIIALGTAQTRRFELVSNGFRRLGE